MINTIICDPIKNKIYLSGNGVELKEIDHNMKEIFTKKEISMEEMITEKKYLVLTKSKINKEICIQYMSGRELQTLINIARINKE